MEPEEIRDHESLQRWLEGRPREDAIWIAQRVALRVLPLWIEEVLRPSGRKLDLAALQILRPNLTSGVARKYPTPEVKAAAFAAYAAASAADAAAHAAYAAAYAADAAAHAARSVYADAAADASYAAARAAVDSAPFAAWPPDDTPWDPATTTRTAVAADARALADGVADNRPLWDTPPDWLLRPLVDMRTTWAPATPGGDFWMRWYQGFFDGTLLPWELQRDIAMIPDEDWQKGEAHIAGLIAVIEERHRLLGLIAELKQQLLAATAVVPRDVASSARRGHNQPPELIEVPVAVREQVSIIRLALDEAEAELVKPDPQPSRLRRIASALAEAVKSALAYCGTKADTFLTKAVEEGGSAFGKWGIAAAIAIWATPSGTMQSLIRGLADLAAKLSP